MLVDGWIAGGEEELKSLEKGELYTVGGRDLRRWGEAESQEGW